MRSTKYRSLAAGALLFGALVLIKPSSNAFAFPNPEDVPLGAAATFSVLAGSTVTNAGDTIVSADAGVGGNVGVSPGTAVTGFPPGVVIPPGTIHSADAAAATAQANAVTARQNAEGRTPNVTFPPVKDLGGQTYTAGVYNDPSSLAVTGTVTLDGQNDPDAVFIFQAGSTLTTAASSNVALINGAQACHVYWQVGSSATLGASSMFNGTILAAVSASLGDAVDVQGRVLADSGAVTLVNDAIHTPACAPDDEVNLSVTMSDSPDPAAQGGNITYTITVTNDGSGLATNAVALIQLALPMVSWVSNTTSQGTCDGTAGIGTIECDFGSLDAGHSATVTLVARAEQPGTVPGLVYVYADQEETTYSDNEATTTTAINGNEADISLTLTAPSSVRVGNNIIYTAVIPNAGPATASGVTFSLPLHPTTTFVKMNKSQGKCTTPAPGSPGTVACSFGSLASGKSVNAKVWAATTQAGTVSATGTISALNPDPTTSDHSVIVTTTVTQGPIRSLTRLLPQWLCPVWLCPQTATAVAVRSATTTAPGSGVIATTRSLTRSLRIDRRRP